VKRRGTWRQASKFGVLAAVVVGIALISGCMSPQAWLPSSEQESCPTCPVTYEGSDLLLGPEEAGSLTTLGASQTAIPPLRWPTDRGAPLGGYIFGSEWNCEKCTKGCDGQFKLHTGIDIGVGKGRPVYAAEDGVVKVVGFNPTWKGWVTIQHELGGTVFTTVYWHINPSVQTGQKVMRGQQIGTVADMGNNTHLHFGVRHAPYSNISNHGALPKTKACGDDHPRFPENFVDPKSVADPVNRPPIVSGVNQYRSDGITAIGEGAAIRENTVVFKATVSDPNGGRVRLEIELRQVTELFNGTPTWDSGLVRSGTQVSWTRGGLVDARYKWRYRVVDEEGLASPWVEFGQAGNTDFIVDRTPPTVPGNLRVTGSTHTRIDIAWNPSTDNLSGIASYRIYRDGQLIATVPGTQTTFRDTNVGALQRYCYRVSAADRAGNESAQSNEACARAVPWPR
jgi:murein DD-endopeptidase MepM/ murein hydrolase activator NlpD